MFNTESSNLTRLLRFIADALPTEEVQQLQADLREDEMLNAQYNKLIQVTAQPFSLDQSLLHSNQVAPDLIAAFIDGGLSQQESILFERQCWNSDSLLREVATLWQIEFDARKTMPPSVGLDSAEATDFQVLNEPAKYPLLASHQQSDPITNPLQSNPTFPEIKNNSPRLKTTPRSKRRLTHRMIPAFIVAAVIAVILIGSWDFFKSKNNGRRTIDDDKIVQQSPKTSNTSPESVVQNDLDPESFTKEPRKPELAPDPGRSSVKPPGDVIVDIPNTNQPNRKPDPLRDPPTEIMQPTPLKARNLSAWITWSDVRGIAATKDASSTTWKGVSWPNHYAAKQAVPWSQVATFAASRLKGGAKDGSQWTAGANTSFKIFQDDDVPDNAVVCELLFGKLAFTNLEAGQTLYFKFDDQNFQVEIAEENTQFMVHRDATHLTLGIFTGAARSGIQEINRRGWKKIDTTGTFTNFRPPKYDAWYNDSIRREQMPATLRNALNGAPDFLAQAIDIGNTGTPLDKSIATQVLLQCSAADRQPPPDQRLQRMMGQQASEAVRASLVKWLVEQYISDPKFGQLIVQRICQIQTMPPQEERTFRGWLNFAARGRQYDQQVLNQLLGSLTQQSTLVVRQTAKYFLEKYLNEPLTQYDPGKPGPANNNRVINYIKQKVDRKSGLNR